MPLASFSVAVGIENRLDSRMAAKLVQSNGLWAMASLSASSTLVLSAAVANKEDVGFKKALTLDSSPGCRVWRGANSCRLASSRKG